MLNNFSPGDRVIFPNPPPNIQDIVYVVLIVWDNLILKEIVCLLSAPGAQLVASFGSEISPLAQGENNVGS